MDESSRPEIKVKLQEKFGPEGLFIETVEVSDHIKYGIAKGIWKQPKGPSGLISINQKRKQDFSNL